MGKIIFRNDLHGDNEEGFKTRMYVALIAWYGNSGWVTDTDFGEMGEEYGGDEDEAFKAIMTEVFNMHDTIFPNHRLDNETRGDITTRLGPDNFFPIDKWEEMGSAFLPMGGVAAHQLETDKSGHVHMLFHYV